jgi:hypothetical protein
MNYGSCLILVVKQEFLTISSQKKMGNEHPAMPAILG